MCSGSRSFLRPWAGLLNCTRFAEKGEAIKKKNLCYWYFRYGDIRFLAWPQCIWLTTLSHWKLKKTRSPIDHVGRKIMNFLMFAELRSTVKKGFWRESLSDDRPAGVEGTFSPPNLQFVRRYNRVWFIIPLFSRGVWEAYCALSGYAILIQAPGPSHSCSYFSAKWDLEMCNCFWVSYGSSVTSRWFVNRQKEWLRSIFLVVCLSFKPPRGICFPQSVTTVPLFIARYFNSAISQKHNSLHSKNWTGICNVVTDHHCQWFTSQYRQESKC